MTIETLTAGNGETLTRDPDTGRLRDTENNYGYWTRWGGAYVCYTCGHLCECGELED